MKLKHVLTGIAPALLVLSSAAFAQSSSDDALDTRYKSWFQIELVIFERSYDTTATSTELWPNTLNLSYPEKVHHLFNPEEWTSTASANSDTNITSTATDPATANPNNLASPAAALANNEGIPLAANTAISDLPAMQVPFIKLPPSMHVLGREAKAIQRRNAFRVLFHEAWRQPLASTKTAKAVAIQGGDKFDKHHELEGSVLISVDRYLHIRTNLWKSKFDINYGQNAEYWPPIPLAPEKFAPHPSSATAGADGEYTDPALTAALAGQVAITDDAQNSNGLIDANSLSLDFSDKHSSSDFSFGNVDLYNQNNLSNFDTIETAPYIVKEIIQLRQKRRMRSNELHYIDHPRLGILIKILPYEMPLGDTAIMPDTAAIK